MIAAAVAALAIGIGKATKAHKDFVKELAGEPQTVEEARAKVEELEQQYEEASKARLEAFSSDAGFSGDTVEMERLAEAIKQAKQNLADLEAQEQAAAEAGRCMNCGCYSVNASDHFGGLPEYLYHHL